MHGPLWHVTAKEYVAQWAERTGRCAARGLAVPSSACAALWREDVVAVAAVRDPYERMISVFHTLLEHDCAEKKRERSRMPFYVDHAMHTLCW